MRTTARKQLSWRFQLNVSYFPFFETQMIIYGIAEAKAILKPIHAAYTENLEKVLRSLAYYSATQT